MSQKELIRLQGWGITILRIVVGVVLLAHGAQKLFGYGYSGTAGFFSQSGVPFPAFTAAFAIFAEVVGGAALVLGLFSRVAALLLAATMFGAVTTVHLKGGFFLPTGVEFALTLLAANVTLILTGGGAFALENLWSDRPARVPNSGELAGNLN